MRHFAPMAPRDQLDAREMHLLFLPGSLMGVC
jgi:hypothetical protein